MLSVAIVCMRRDTEFPLLFHQVRPKKEKGEGDNADDMDSADEDSYEEMLASAGVRATATKQSGYKVRKSRLCASNERC